MGGQYFFWATNRGEGSDFFFQEKRPYQISLVLNVSKGGSSLLAIFPMVIFVLKSEKDGKTSMIIQKSNLDVHLRGGELNSK